jgi:hypothetical protein
LKCRKSVEDRQGKKNKKEMKRDFDKVLRNNLPKSFMNGSSNEVVGIYSVVIGYD